MTKYIFLLCHVAALSPTFASDVQTVSTAKAIAFVENKGQVTDQYYQSRRDIDFKIDAGNGLSVFVGKGAIHYQFYKEVENTRKMEESPALYTGLGKPGMYNTQNREIEMYRMDVELVGANKNARIIPEGRLSYYENYYTTGTGEKGVRVYPYTRVIYKDVYPNIDWVLYTSPDIKDGQRSIKYDFIVHPGGNPANIRLRYQGATSITLNEDGSITAATPQGTIIEQAPVSYQADKEIVYSKYVLQGNVLSFDIGEYYGTLVIDPTLDWGTYFGGSGHDEILDITVDSNGFILGTGFTESNNIATVGAHQTNIRGSSDAFALKFTNEGMLTWATYFGGSGYDFGMGISIGSNNTAIITGATRSTNGISTAGSHQLQNKGESDAFLAKFDESGLRVWATYFGGSGLDQAHSVYTDRAGATYVGGMTTSASGIATSGAHQMLYAGGTTYGDGYLAKFNETGKIIWATYYGGAGTDIINDIVGSNSGYVYVAGTTASSNAIASQGSYQPVLNGDLDVFLAKFDSNANRIWGTYYGGDTADMVEDIDVDSLGNVYLVGFTRSNNSLSLASPNAHQEEYIGFGLDAGDSFLAKFNNSGYREWGTYYGGAGNDNLLGVCVDNLMNVYIVGATRSNDNIATPDAYQSSLRSKENAHLAKFSKDGVREWGTYFGGESFDFGFSIRTGVTGSIYIAGRTISEEGITKSGAHQTTFGGAIDGFLAKFCDGPPVLNVITGVSSLYVGDTARLNVFTPAGIFGSVNKLVTISTDGIVTGVWPGVDTITYTIVGVCDSSVSRHPISIMDYMGINIYPNPVSNVLTIVSDNEIQRIEVLNLYGQKLIVKDADAKKALVDMSSLIPGVYIIKVNDGGFVSRVVKE